MTNTTLLAYAIIVAAFTGFAWTALAADPKERRAHINQLCSALFVGGVLLLITPP